MWNKTGKFLQSDALSSLTPTQSSMTHNTCTRAIEAYLDQLSSGFEASPSNHGCFILTPFLRPDGEPIELELWTPYNRDVSINDMGDSLGYLYVNGLTLSRSIMESVRHITSRFGVTLDRNVLEIRSNEVAVGDAIHRLIQATLAVSNLIQKRRSMFRVKFEEEVESLIIYSGVTYDVGYGVRGRRERHTMRFHVDTGRNLLIQPVSAAQQNAAHSWAERLAYRFADIRQESDRWRIAAVLDDRGRRESAWTGHALTPIKEHAILWSQKEQLEELLHAPNEQDGGDSPIYHHQ